MGDKVKNRVVVLEPTTKSTKELLAQITEKGLADIVPVTTPDAALQEIAASLPCMMIACILDNGEVPGRIQMFKRLENAIKAQGLKIYVVTPLKNRQLGDLITQKMGVADYIMEPVPVRTMFFKANLQLKAVDNFRRQQELKKLADEQIVIKKLDAKKAEGQAASEVKPGQKPALQMAEDTFLFKNNGVKKAGKKYTMEMDGPDPSTGEWVPHEDKGDAQSAWRWVPNEEKEKQAKGEAPKDGWVHSGDKPVFNETTNKWSMTSEKPSLALKKKEETVAQKVGTDEKGDVFVAEDSPAAEENLKKNRAAAEQKKKEKAKPNPGDLLGKEIPTEAAGEADANGDGPGRARTRKAKGPGEAPGEDAAKFNDQQSAGKDDGVSAGELKDKRESVANDAISMLNGLKKKKDRTGNEEAAAPAPKAEEAEAKKPVSPLDFLKKKKEELEKSAVTSIAADPAPQGVNPLAEEEDEKLEGPEVRGKKSKKKRDKNKDKMDRLAAGLDDTGEEDDSDAEAVAGAGESGEEKPEDPAIALALKDEAERAKAEALRSDPAEKRAAVNDLQGEGAKAEGPKTKALKAKKKKALDDIQARLQEALPEDVSGDDEAKLRAELGLQDRPDVKPKDLVRKKRLKDVKAMKDKLALLDEEIDAASGEEGEALRAAQQEDGPLHRQGDLSADKLNGIRQALDSEESPEEEDEENVRLKKKDKDDKKKGINLEDNSFYLPEAELLPLGNAWESAGTHYVYLNSSVRYRGFDKLDELLPLWVAATEEVPQLLDKTKQWRFRGGKPLHAKTLAEVPESVREFLIGIRDQLKKEDEEEAPAEAAASRDEDKAGEPSDAEKAAGALDAAAADEAGAESAAEKGTEGEEAAPVKKRRQKKAQTEEAGADSTGPEAGNGEKEDKLAAMRAKLGLDKAEEQTGEGLPAAEDTPAEAKTEGEPTSQLEAAKDSLEAYAEKLGGASGKKSAAMEKFLERRRKKLAEGLGSTKDESANASAEAVAAAKASGRSVYLGVMIALADATSPDLDGAKALERVLNSLEIAFGNCFAACVDLPDSEGKSEIRTGSVSAPKSGEKVELSQGFSVPIIKMNGNSEEVLAHLYLQVGAGREALGPAEEKTVRQAAARLWTILPSDRAETSAA